MSRLIVHLLLVLSLILNGVSAAALAASAPALQGSADVMAEQASQDAPCHDMMADEVTTAPAPASDHPDGGCCDPQRPCQHDTCDSMGAQTVMLGPPVVPAMTGEDLGQRYRAVVLLGRDDPSLRQLVRPPIA